MIANRIAPPLMLIVLGGAAVLMLEACASAPKPAARSSARPDRLCETADPRVAPLGVRVINLSEDSVTIFTEVCKGAARVGDVIGGATRIFTFPNDIVPRRGVLWLRIHRNGSLEHSTVEVLQMERRLFELEIPKEAPRRCVAKLYVNGEKMAEGAPRVPRGMILRVDVLIDAENGPACPALNYITREP